MPYLQQQPIVYKIFRKQRVVHGQESAPALKYLQQPRQPLRQARCRVVADLPTAHMVIPWRLAFLAALEVGEEQESRSSGLASGAQATEHMTSSWLGTDFTPLKISFQPSCFSCEVQEQE